MAKKNKKKPVSGYIDLFAEDEELEGTLSEDMEPLFEEEQEESFSPFERREKKSSKKKSSPKKGRRGDRPEKAATRESYDAYDAYEGYEEYGEAEKPSKDSDIEEPTIEDMEWRGEDYSPKAPDTAQKQSFTWEDKLDQQEESARKGRQEEEKETFSFDRYGRRTGNRPKKNRKEEYGRRRNAKKADTTVVTKETDASREQAEARQRAQARDAYRQQQEKIQQEKRRKQRQEEFRRRLNTAGVLGGLVLLVLVAAYFAFLIQGIDVTGTLQRYSKEQIVEMSGLKVNRHILSQDLEEATQKLEEDPYLNVTVKYVFPNRISIAVKERKAMGAVQWGPNSEYLAIVDGNGTILESDADSRQGLPLVEGMIVTRIVAGEQIGDDADEQVQSMLDILNGLDDFGLLYKIARADLSETMGISLYTEEGYRIEVGNAKELTTKFTRLKNNWSAIMEKSLSFTRQGADNVTIYLYSKNGVTISPHELGYVVPTSTPEILSGATPEMSTPTPESPEVVEPNTTPSPTEPVDTVPPYQNDPFTG